MALLLLDSDFENVYLPKQLTIYRKYVQVIVCSELPQHHIDDEMLSQILTGNETWIHHFKPKKKLSYMNFQTYASGCVCLRVYEHVHM